MPRSGSSDRLLLCTDLDRTILPNGREPESPQARPLLRALAARPEVTLAYVSGRDRTLLLDAIDAYDIPVPDYAIGDVGTTIYETAGGDWRRWHAWEEEIASDWNGRRHDELAALFTDLRDLAPQEPGKQNVFKLSYYTPERIDGQALLGEMQTRLTRYGIRASLIWSVDEAAHCGLLDVLPRSATKIHAIRFLMRQTGFDDAHTVFAGDSGNDLPALTSGLQAVLVRNAHPDVRREAQRLLRDAGLSERLYIARGGFRGMNGHYAAGVLEGVQHFLPQVADWLSPAGDRPSDAGSPVMR